MIFRIATQFSQTLTNCLYSWNELWFLPSFIFPFFFLLVYVCSTSSYTHGCQSTHVYYILIVFTFPSSAHTHLLVPFLHYVLNGEDKAIWEKWEAQPKVSFWTVEKKMFRWLSAREDPLLGKVPASLRLWAWKPKEETVDDVADYLVTFLVAEMKYPTPKVKWRKVY